jgi:hypothetical protein
MQTDILDRRPDNRLTTGLCREHVDLISPLPHIAKKTFNGVGGLNVPVHHLGELVKGQHLVFLLRQASHRFPDSVCHIWRVLVSNWTTAPCRLPLLPNPHEFGLNERALSFGDSIEDVALLMRPASVDERWPQTVARRRPAVHHARR